MSPRLQYYEFESLAQYIPSIQKTVDSINSSLLIPEKWYVDFEDLPENHVTVRLYDEHHKKPLPTGTKYRRHLVPRITIERTNLMSTQAYSDGTLPDYFLNIHRKASMTKEEIEQEKKQLQKLYMNNYITYEKEDYYTEKEEQ